MVLMPPARLLRSATKALRNSIANTAVSSASRPCGTFGQFFPQMFRDSNRSVVSDSSPSSIAQACALRLIELAHTSCGVLSEWSATLPQSDYGRVARTSDLDRCGQLRDEGSVRDLQSCSLGSKWIILMDLNAGVRLRSPQLNSFAGCATATNTRRLCFLETQNSPEAST